MKKTLPPLSLLMFSLLFWGCTRHQFVYVEGEEDFSYSNHFLVQNDSLEILYDFSGNNLPVNIRVRNKSDKPVYVDWKKSVAIIDGKKYNYWNEISTVGVTGSNIAIDGTGSGFFQGEGSIVKDERITYIPPFSYIETTRIFLQTAFFENLPAYNREFVSFQTENGPVRVKKFSFTEANSPLIFRSLLTFSSKESFSEETMIENTFWISEILEAPQYIFNNQQSNRTQGRSLNNPSVISKVTGFGLAAGTVGVLGVTTGLILLAPDENTE